jgi:hypothetical protein
MRRTVRSSSKANGRPNMSLNGQSVSVADAERPAVPPLIAAAERSDRRNLLIVGVVAAVVIASVLLWGGDDGSTEEATPPPPLSARIELDAQTVTIGGTIDGRVVVANNTGENIHVIGCKQIFKVALANEEYAQQIGWLMCAEPFTIPTGESSYPVTVRAEHLGCVGGPPYQPDDIRCDSPFPPGDYEARLYQGYNGRKVPEPPPADVRVVTDP